MNSCRIAAENFHDFLAGIVGGSAGVAVGQPLDVVRIRMQTSTTSLLPNGQPLTTLSCLRDIGRKEGVRGFFRGLAPPLAGLAALNATVFGCYGGTCRFLKGDSNSPLTLAQIGVAGRISESSLRPSTFTFLQPGIRGVRFLTPPPPPPAPTPRPSRTTSR